MMRRNWDLTRRVCLMITLVGAVGVMSGWLSSPASAASARNRCQCGCCAGAF